MASVKSEGKAATPVEAEELQYFAVYGTLSRLMRGEGPDDFKMRSVQMHATAGPVQWSHFKNEKYIDRIRGVFEAANPGVKYHFFVIDLVFPLGADPSKINKPDGSTHEWLVMCRQLNAAGHWVPIGTTVYTDSALSPGSDSFSQILETTMSNRSFEVSSIQHVRSVPNADSA
jgi:hypothetical protein